MIDSKPALAYEDERRLMSAALLVRFVLVIAGGALMALLPWAYPDWLKIAAVMTWVVVGIVAARALSGAQTFEAVRAIGRNLWIADAVTVSAVTYVYLPTYHDTFAAMSVIIVAGALFDRLPGALVAGVAETAVLFANEIHPAVPARFPPLRYEFLQDIVIVWMTVGAVSVLLRAVERRGDVLSAQTARLRQTADAEAALRAASEAQADRMHKVIELVVTLMRERELGTLLDRILDATMQTFGFRCGAIMTAERDREVFAYRSVRGYPPDQTRRLMVREVPFAQANLKLDPRFLIRPSTYYAPVERQSWHTDPLTCYRPELALLPRERRGAWHEADTLLFTLTSSTGEIIGLLCPDTPLDGQVPQFEALDNIAQFARLAAAAIENVYFGSIEPHREVAERVAKTLDLTAAIFTERDLDALLHRILSATCDSFGFNAGTILLRESGRDSYVRRAAQGFPREVEGAEVSGASLREMMSERARVRDTFYYVPMELNVQGGVTRDPNRAILPRVESGQWHENDLLLFPIFDSSGSLIGVLTPDDPKDRRVPPYETIGALEVFARIAGLAIEAALIRDMARTL